MNGKMHTLSVQPREQRPAKAIDAAQDSSIEYQKAFYLDASDPQDNANDITVTDSSLTLDTSQWDTFTEVPPPLGVTTTIYKNTESNTFAYTYRWESSAATTKYLLVIFARLPSSSAIESSAIEAVPVGVWMGTSVGGSTPECLKGYTAYKPAKLQA